MSNTEKPIEYAGPTGRERPGEHWNARIIREQNEAKGAQSVMADGITDEMITAAAKRMREYMSLLVDLGGETQWADLAKMALTAGLAGRAVVDLPEPTAWRNRLDGDMDIWPIGGWSVTASPDGVGISTSRDGLGGGIGFRDGGQASEIGAALIAADRRLAAKQATEVAGGGAPWLLFVPVLVGYAQALRYLSFRRSDEPLWSQLATFALSPIATLWMFFVLRPVRWYGMATCLRTGWGTRKTVEVTAP